MPINVRAKGARGERDVALSLNGIIGTVMREQGYPEPEVMKGFTRVQRNPLQSAIGGKDLTGTWNLCVEVKRQETLLINKWWQQTCVSAGAEADGIPILIYRQNQEEWKVIMPGCLSYVSMPTLYMPVQISWHNFLLWFRHFVMTKFPRCPS